eukprot:1013840-Pyramimonas_sp.AAC.1
MNLADEATQARLPPARERPTSPFYVAGIGERLTGRSLRASPLPYCGCIPRWRVQPAQRACSYSGG